VTPPVIEPSVEADLDLDAISLDTLILEPLFVDDPADIATPTTEPSGAGAARLEPARHTEKPEPSSGKTSSRVDKAAVRAWEHELGLGKAPTGAPALWRVSEGLPDEPESEPVHHEAMEPVAEAVTVDVTTQAPTKRKRSRKGAAPHDDWAYFDPSQTRFKALVRRLDEIVARYTAA
jgi:hypothetical protein